MYQINYDENTCLNLTGINVVFINDDIYLDKIYYYDSNNIEYTLVSIELVTDENIYWVKTNKNGVLRVDDSKQQKDDVPPTINNRNISRNHFYIIAADKEDIPLLVKKLNSATIIDYKQLPTNPNSLISYLKKY